MGREPVSVDQLVLDHRRLFVDVVHDRGEGILQRAVAHNVQALIVPMPFRGSRVVEKRNQGVAFGSLRCGKAFLDLPGRDRIGGKCLRTALQAG